MQPPGKARKTIRDLFFPHEAVLREIFGNNKPESANERLDMVLANRDKLTRDQQQILREGLTLIEDARRNPVSRQAGIDIIQINALLVNLAEPYADDDRLLGTAEDASEAARFARSYIPLTMKAQDYLWWGEDIDARNPPRTARLAELDDGVIEQLMEEHKEMITVMHENPDIAQYYPCMAQAAQLNYSLDRVLNDLKEQHRQLWLEIAAMRDGYLTS